ncbi:hypothetical protein A2U01_0076650 [Trifolium medium]|uniref:Uncharacterized protein n=1 Tax=Trifolium medium TaxID=97028 RepID=A0A392T5G5_9FABA|nr:hypothetical protein [Trifolium medium]
MQHHHTTLADLKIDDEPWEIARKLGPPKEKGTHHKPTTTTEREVAPVEPKRHTEDSSIGKSDLTQNNKHPPRKSVTDLEQKKRQNFK